ncbi:MAG: hypothetical protein AAF587_10820 [Bacteroidota bacterium]
MKINLIITTIFALFSIAFVGTAAAQSTSKIAKEQINQQKRIHQGVRSGQLTKAEVIQLEKQQKKVQQHKKAAKADGKVTRRERRAIKAHQKAASRNIYHQKHDRQNRRR